MIFFFNINFPKRHNDENLYSIDNDPDMSYLKNCQKKPFSEVFSCVIYFDEHGLNTGVFFVTFSAEYDFKVRLVKKCRSPGLGADLWRQMEGF